jgi:hypothetical protein
MRHKICKLKVCTIRTSRCCVDKQKMSLLESSDGSKDMKFRLRSSRAVGSNCASTV